MAADPKKPSRRPAPDDFPGDSPRPRKGTESPPELTPEDDAALDRAWAKVMARRSRGNTPSGDIDGSHRR